MKNTSRADALNKVINIIAVLQILSVFISIGAIMYLSYLKVNVKWMFLVLPIHFLIVLGLIGLNNRWCNNIENQK
jgi:hypothetical protein